MIDRTSNLPPSPARRVSHISVGTGTRAPVVTKLRTIGDRDAWFETRVARDTSDAEARVPRSLTGKQPG